MTVIFISAAFIAGIAISAAVLVAAWRADYNRNRKKRHIATAPAAAEPLKLKRRIEFSKFIVALYAFACIAWITADYVLAFMYQQPINTQVTVTLTTTVVVALLGYYAKSAFEKSSRNKYSLDENGMPFSISDSEGD